MSVPRFHPLSTAYPILCLLCRRCGLNTDGATCKPFSYNLVPDHLSNQNSYVCASCPCQVAILGLLPLLCLLKSLLHSQWHLRLCLLLRAW